MRLLGRTPGWLGYEFPPEHQGSKAGKGWKGQKQVWFALAFEGEDTEVDLAGHDGALEFDAWRWAELDEALAADRRLQARRLPPGDRGVPAAGG